MFKNHFHSVRIVHSNSHQHDSPLCFLLLLLRVSAITINGGTQIPQDGGVLDTFVAWLSGNDACSQRAVISGTSPCGSTFALNGAQYVFGGCNGGARGEVTDNNGNTLGQCSTRSITNKLDCSNSPYPIYWSYECVVSGAAASTVPTISALLSSTQTSTVNTATGSSSIMTTGQSQISAASSQTTTLPTSNTVSSPPPASSSQSTTLSPSATAVTTPSSTATPSPSTTSSSSSGLSLDAKIALGVGLGLGIPTFILAVIMLILAIIDCQRSGREGRARRSRAPSYQLGFLRRGGRGKRVVGGA